MVQSWFWECRFVVCLFFLLGKGLQDGCKPTLYRLLNGHDGKMKIRGHGLIQALTASSRRDSLICHCPGLEIPLSTPALKLQSNIILDRVFTSQGTSWCFNATL